MATAHGIRAFASEHLPLEDFILSARVVVCRLKSASVGETGGRRIARFSRAKAASTRRAPPQPAEPAATLTLTVDEERVERTADGRTSGRHESIDRPGHSMRACGSGGTDAEPRWISPRGIPRSGQRGADSSGWFIA